MPTAVTRLTCEKTTTEVIQRTKLTQSDLNNKYDDSYWLNVYAEILNYELNSVLDSNDLDKIMNNAQDINKNIDLNSAKSYINGVFSNLRYPSEQRSNVMTRTDIASTTIQTTDTSTDTATTSTSTSGGTSGGSSGGGGGY